MRVKASQDMSRAYESIKCSLFHFPPQNPTYDYNSVTQTHRNTPAYALAASTCRASKGSTNRFRDANGFRSGPTSHSTL